MGASRGRRGGSGIGEAAVRTISGNVHCDGLMIAVRCGTAGLLPALLSNDVHQHAPPNGRKCCQSMISSVSSPSSYHHTAYVPTTAALFPNSALSTFIICLQQLRSLSSIPYKPLTVFGSSPWAAFRIFAAFETAGAVLLSYLSAFAQSRLDFALPILDSLRLEIGAHLAPFALLGLILATPLTLCTDLSRCVRCFTLSPLEGACRFLVKCSRRRGRQVRSLANSSQTLRRWLWLCSSSWQPPSFHLTCRTTSAMRL